MKTKLLVFGALCASLCASVQGQVVDKNPVLHFSFDNVNGTTVVNDGSGGATLNGTLTGSATIVGGGRFGNALSITGTTASSAYVHVANAVVPLTVGNNWTLAMWIQTTAAGGCYAYQGDGGWGPNNSSFYLNNGSGAGTFQGGVRYGTGWETGTTAVNDGNWHQLVMVCNGTVKTLYLDGVVDPFPGAANAYNGDGWTTTAAGAQLYIGGNGYSGDGSVNLSGLIDEVWMFNRALTTNDITQLYTLNTVPTVPVTVTVSPTNGYLGQAFTVTATATPAAGTATNATVDLTAMGMASGLKLVQTATANVFTNTFTVTNTAPFGAANVKVTVIDTEPLVGSAGATFTVVPRPPTNAIVVTQLKPASVYAYDEVSFTFNATNDAPSVGTFPMTYAWYKNSTLVSTNPMGPNFTFLTRPADAGALIQCIATVANTNYSSISVTSSLVTLSVNTTGTPQYPGLKMEVFVGATARANVEIGNVPAGAISAITNADTGSTSGVFGDNTSRRYSGWFIPATTDNYIFFLASDDDCDLFLSTDATPDNKQLIAQEYGYSGLDAYHTPGGNGSVASQKRSDQWTNSVGATPWSGGIPLVAGQQYYFESVEHNGTGGDNMAVSFTTAAEQVIDSTQPVDGSPSRMTTASNNIVLATYTGSTIAFATKPHAVTVYQGFGTNFIASATNDAGMSPTYQWYINIGGAGYAPVAGATGPSLALSLIPTSYNGALVEVVASTPLSSLSVTSPPVAITVLQSVTEVGFLKLQRWNTITSIAALEAGTSLTANYTLAIPQFGASVDNPSGDNNFVRQITGYFIPPTTGSYKFYTTGDDDSDLFLSTDNTPGHKRKVCAQAGWNSGAMWAWDAVGGGGASAAQMNSSTWSPDGGVTVPYAAGIALTAGQQYYIEQDWHQGGGGANNAADFALISAADPAVGTPSAFIGNAIAMSAIRCTYVAFTTQPASTNVPAQGYATFSASGTTDGTVPIGTVLGFEENQGSNYLFFQWYKNGVAIPGANASSLTLGPLQPGDNNSTIYCQMRALGYANAALTPIWSNSLSATLTVSQGVFETGLLNEAWWTNGTARSQEENGSLGAPQFGYTVPSWEGPSGTGNGNGPTINFVQKISGFFIPPTTEPYVFFTDSDDDSDLFVSTDATAANKTQVAQEAGWSGVRNWLSAGGGGTVVTQKRSDSWSPDGGLTVPWASGISMTAGQKYYMEQVHHNGAAGGTHATATFKGYFDADPVNGTQTAFRTNWIGTYVPQIPWVAFLQQPTNVTQLSGGNPVTFTVAGQYPPSSLFVGTSDNPITFIYGTNDQSHLQYQWYKNNVAIPGATAASYTQPTVLPSDAHAQFVCAMRAYGYADSSQNRIYSNSVPAVLTVVTDTVPPTIVSAVTFVNTNWPSPLIVVDITFSKWMNTATLASTANYSVPGATVTNVVVASNNRTVELDLNQMPTLPVVVTVHSGKDLSGNSLAANSTQNIVTDNLNFSDVGTPGTDPAYPSYIWIEGNGGYLVSAEGSDIFNAHDGFNFGWEQKTGDFDVVTRGVSNGHTSNFAKMGLMVRETLDPASRNWNVINDPTPNDGVSAPDGSGSGANNVECNYRTNYGSASISWKNSGNNAPTYPNAWVRIKRTGTVLTGFSSTNGVNWAQLAIYDTATNTAGALASTVLVGICTTAHNNDPIASLAPPPPPYLYYNTAEYAGYNSSFVAAPPVLSISVSGGNVNISWTPSGGTLYSSPALGAGANWQPVGTANPETVPVGAGAQFFRVIR